MNGGAAALTDCTFSGNTADEGGAIWNDGALTIAGCTFTTETDTIWNAGTLTVTGETAFSGTVKNVKDGTFTVSLTDLTPDSTAAVDGWAFLSGGNTGIAVAAAMATGTYKVASGIGSWSGDIALTVDAAAAGSAFTVSNGAVTAGTVSFGNRRYDLSMTENILTLTISGDAPAAASVRDDLNGDGRADIVMTISQSGHSAYGATGAWLIQQGDQPPVWDDLSQRNEGWEIFGTGVTSAGKTSADVYLKSTGNVVGAWITDDSGKITGWQTVETFDSATQVLGLGDFNGDGQSDLLLRNENGAVGSYLTAGDTPGWNYFQSLGDEWSIAAIGDLNGDGRSDTVLVHDAGFAGTWLTQSDGTVLWSNLDTLADGFSVAGTGDFNGDGVDDVLLQKDTYFGAWLVQDGSAQAWFGIGDLGEVSVEQISDFDGDGKDDLRIRTAAGDLGAQLVKGADTLVWKYYGSVGAEWSTSLASI